MTVNMEDKSITLSSAGLKNLVLNSNITNDTFCFIFGKKKLLINNVFAEFISPMVSRFHQSDPTLKVINFNKDFKSSSDINKVNYSDVFNDENISLIEQLSKGNSINIPESQIINMQVLSILLGNEELFQKINEINSIKNDPNSIEFSLQQIELFYYCSRLSNNSFDYPKAIDFISSHFYSIDEERLKKLPKAVLYSIISNSNLKIKSEDWLFDFINEIFINENESEDISISEFYEQLNFLTLSEAKFEEFLQKFKINQITKEIWQKLSQCFYINYYMAFDQADKQRYVSNDNEEDESEVNNIVGKFINSKFEEYNKKDLEKSEVTNIDNNNNKPINGKNFDFDGKDNFKGIISHFIEESGSKFSEKVVVTSSSQFIGRPLFVTELTDKLKYFMSDNQPNSWIKYEFVDFKLRPTSYSIRSWDNAKDGGHLKNWVIEGSKTDNDNDWKILDTRSNVNDLNDNNAEMNFEIQTKLKQDEFFKYIRLKQTGANVSGKNFLILSAFELFGTVVNDE